MYPHLLQLSIVITLALTLSPQAGLAQIGYTYPVVDTGQTECYDNSSHITCPDAGAAFYGQDAQYDGNQPGYTDHGNGTITDNVTGLMWSQSPDTNGDGLITAADKLTYAQALAGAAAFNLAGYTDWRLPTIKELYSLILFDGLDPSGPPGNSITVIPFIDTRYFEFAYGDTTAGERTIDAQFASSTRYVSTTMHGDETMFGVNFADGRIKGYGLTGPGGKDEKTFFVLYVRGNTAYGQNSFVDNGDGTITDHATGLMWQQVDSGAGLDWAGALSYCENTATAGYTDWRLPNAKELQSIVDYSRSPDTTGSAAIDPLFSVTAFTNEAGQPDYPFYWSSTTHANLTGGQNAAYVSFGRALGYMHTGWLDVHGAGTQRSDPKSGNSANYPTGHGPQGDAIRIDNYARCVRGGDTSSSPADDEVSLRPGLTIEMSSMTSGQPNDQSQRPTGGIPLADQQPGRMPPPEAIAACRGQGGGASCQFTSPHGQVSGTCRQVQPQLACVPIGGPPPGH